MVNGYLVASALLFTLMAVASTMPPRRDTDVIAGVVTSVAGTWAWACVAERLLS